MLQFKVEAQAIVRFKLGVERKVLGRRFGLALQAQQLCRQAAPRREAGIPSRLGQGAGLEHAVIVKGPGAAIGLHREASISVHQCQDGVFVAEELGLRAQILGLGRQSAIPAFELRDGRKRLAVAFQPGCANTGPLRHDDRICGREVGRVEISVAEAARAHIPCTQTGRSERIGTVAGVSQLRRIGAADEFGAGIAQLKAELAAAARLPGI